MSWSTPATNSAIDPFRFPNIADRDAFAATEDAMHLDVLGLSTCSLQPLVDAAEQLVGHASGTNVGPDHRCALSLEPDSRR